MDLNQRKEQFSVAYLRAVAAVAGCTVMKPEVDDDSVDYSVAKKASGRPRLDVQLKCTAESAFTENHLSFELPLKNYDDLRLEPVLVPRFLVVVVVPGDDPASWIPEQTEDRLVMAKCGYSCSLRGAKESKNKKSVTVKISRSDVFTPAALEKMLGEIGAKS